MSIADDAEAQPPGTNYDEAEVPRYTLPDPLLDQEGRPVRDAEAWRAARRGEVLELFRAHVYGRQPERPAAMRFEVLSAEPALDGRAIRKQVAIRLTGQAEGPTLELLVYLPAAARGPVPCFLGLNFAGNHAIHADPGIRLSTRWMRDAPDKGVREHRATEAARGTTASRWPVELILSRGYAVATMYYGDIEPDHPEGWRDGVRSVFRPVATGGAAPGAPPATESAAGAAFVGGPADAPGDAWGAIAAWAWGLSRGLDYLETDPAIDGRQVAVLGHSRLGKTALWAGAEDQRFAIVISNNSGEGGAALARRRFGERTAHLNERFPHWFCRNFHAYSDREDALPVDQHELLALAAPRPLYVASATEDRWADPRGEFLALRAAEPVYALFGLKGTGVDEWPAPDRAVGDVLGYHLRTGAHDVTEIDWRHYLDFADRHFGR